MNKHTKSLLFSLVIHSLLLAAFIYTYKTVSESLFSKKSSPQKRICISLGTLTSQPKIKKETAVVSQKKPAIKKSVHKKPPPKKKSVKKEKVVPKKKTKVPETKPVKEAPQNKVQKEKETVKEPEEKTVLPVPTKGVQKEEDCPLACCSHPSKEQVYTEKNLAIIAKLLQKNLSYPRRARKRGIEGEVIVKFTLKTNAEVTDIEIVSSKSDVLSRGAVKTLENLSGKFPKPDEALTLTVPIDYKLQ
ncbi:TonB family protein [Sulfurimonas paralvinellae]|uniref:TonB family protein n=1 Tax=Sulfurimonas paralvinellae TaxID=317658 RepID=A0A7M1B8V0_9BACT|nr:energy transducer TonB [Sulfurimonas paralvinellae]QOP45248.1 TonB family protein [Sulfurimonas paralvinellae]